MTTEPARRAVAVLMLGLFGCGPPEPPPNPDLKVPKVAPGGRDSRGDVKGKKPKG